MAFFSPRLSPKRRSQRSVRTRSTKRRTRPLLEILEDRLVLSTTNVDFADLDYQQWRETEFALDQIAVTETSLDFVDGGGDLHAANAAANELIGLDRVFAQYPYRGTGYSVAVIDTGIDYNHPAFSGRYIGGYDFANDDIDPYDDNGHGTHVAGLIGSGDSTYVGVAPQVNLIALKVLTATGSGSFGDVEDALNWVIQNQSQYNIVAVNMSLGTGNYTTNPFTFLENEFSTLRSQGVFIAAAAGNSYYSVGGTQGLGFPATSPQTVSVGAVWAGNFGNVGWADGGRDFTTAADRVTAFTQRSSELDIMAPGALLTNARSGGGWVTMAGTSMATPVAAGAAAIIHEALDATGQGHLANQEHILSIMQSTGVRIYDGDDENDNVNNSHRYYQRLDLAAALESIGGSLNNAPVLQHIDNRTMQPGQDTLSVALNVSDADGDPLSFGAVVSVDDDIAFQLDQQYGFYQHPEHPNFAYNYYGHQEKWLATEAGLWFAILPNGELRQAAGDRTFTDPSLIAAELAPSFYDDPALLINVPPPSANQIATRFEGHTLILDPPDGFVAGFQVTVTVSDGASTDSQSFSVSIRNSAPVLSPIDDQVMSHSQDTLTIPLEVSDADGDSLSFDVDITTNADVAYQLDRQYGFYQHSQHPDFAYNYHGHQEKWLAGDKGDWFAILPNGDLRLAAGSRTFTDSALVITTFDVSYYNDPSLLIDVPLPTTHGIDASVSGNLLTIDPPNGFAGGFDVNLSVSDGIRTVWQSFAVSVRNSAPVLSPIADQVMSRNLDTLSIPLNAQDADGDSLSFEVDITTDAAVAYQLDQQFGFFQHPQHHDFAFNLYGYQEKWLATDSGQWFTILPNGELRHQVANRTFTDPSLVIAKFDASYYDDPSLIINVETPTTHGITASVSGSNLVIDPPNGFAGSFKVNVSATDGNLTTSQTFTVAVRNSAPVLQPIGDQVMHTDQDTLRIDLDASDPDGDALTYGVEVVTDEQIAYQLDQQYGFYRHAEHPNYALSYYGYQEKWLFSDAGLWFVIMPNGEVRHSVGSRTFSDPSVIVQLDSRFYDNPALLINAAQPPSNQVDTRVIGNELVIDPADGYAHPFRVHVTASDGVASASQSFAVNFRDDGEIEAPTLAPIADQSATFGQLTLAVPFEVSDPGATITAQLLHVDNWIWNHDQQYGFDFAGSYYLNYLGRNEKWLTGANGAWYIIEPNGEVRQWNTNAGTTLAAAPILTLPTAFYTNPELLWDASASFQLNYSIANSALTINLPSGFIGSFTVSVTADNGSASASQSFDVTVSV